MPQPTPCNLRLRAWEQQDAPRMAELVNNPAVYRFLAAELPTPYTVEHAQEFISHCAREASMVECAIVRGDDVVGTIGAALRGAEATIGYWLGEAYWQQGIMTAALPLFIAHLPEGITHLHAMCFDFNTASQALLRRAGFSAAETTQELAKDGQHHPLQHWHRAR